MIRKEMKELALFAVNSEFPGEAWTWDKLCIKNRKRHYVRRRWYAMAYFRLNKYSYPVIAKAFGFSDHTTVIYGVDLALKEWGSEHFEGIVERDQRDIFKAVRKRQAKKWEAKRRELIENASVGAVIRFEREAA